MGGPGIESIDRTQAAVRLAEFPALLDLALKAQTRARVPYSRFPVGAAVLTGSGRQYMGCNVESASYGATICAERTAIVSAIAAGETDIRACVVVTPTREPSSPCGICRQLLAEFGPDVMVFAGTPRGERVMAARLGDLLPLAFWAGDLAARTDEGGGGQ